MIIEKLMNVFNLTKANKNITDKLKNENTARMQFYDKIKMQFSFEDYLDLPNFSQRKAITKFR